MVSVEREMMKLYKAVFIDIDGTLKNDERIITKRTKDAIKEVVRIRYICSNLFR